MQLKQFQVLTFDCFGTLICEHGELPNLLRPRRHHNQTISASLRRSRFAKAICIALEIMTVA